MQYNYAGLHALRKKLNLELINIISILSLLAFKFSFSEEWDNNDKSYYSFLLKIFKYCEFLLHGQAIRSLQFACS